MSEASIDLVIADDHRIFRDGMRALLSTQPDMTVLAEAEDGEAALRLVRELRPRLLLLDLSMPVLSGLELLPRLRQQAPDCACLVLSMLVGAPSVSRALALGARGYLAKGTSAAELCTAIRAVAGGRRYLQPELTDAALAHTQPAANKLLTQLSAREQQVVQGVCAGQTSADIGARLHLSAKTVDTYRSRLMHKLGVDNLPALLKLALREGWTSLDD